MHVVVQRADVVVLLLQQFHGGDGAHVELRAVGLEGLAIRIFLHFGRFVFGQSRAHVQVLLQHRLRDGQLALLPVEPGLLQRQPALHDLGLRLSFGEDGDAEPHARLLAEAVGQLRAERRVVLVSRAEAGVEAHGRQVARLRQLEVGLGDAHAVAQHFQVGQGGEGALERRLALRNQLHDGHRQRVGIHNLQRHVHIHRQQAFQRQEAVVAAGAGIRHAVFVAGALRFEQQVIAFQYLPGGVLFPPLLELLFAGDDHGLLVFEQFLVAQHAQEALEDLNGQFVVVFRRLERRPFHLQPVLFDGVADSPPLVERHAGVDAGAAAPCRRRAGGVADVLAQRRADVGQPFPLRLLVARLRRLLREQHLLPGEVISQGIIQALRQAQAQRRRRLRKSSTHIYMYPQHDDYSFHIRSFYDAKIVCLPHYGV